MEVREQLARSGLITMGLSLLVVVDAAPARSAGAPFAAMAVDRTGLPVPAPDIAFRSLEGQEVRLSALRGRVVLLGFFTTS